MPFDKSLVPPKAHPDVNAFGSRCAAITPGSGDQISPAGRYFNYFVAGAAADVTFTAYQDDDATEHTISLAAGQALPGRVRRITAATGAILGWYE